MNLYQKTLKLLADKPPEITLQVIAQELELSYSWVCKFSAKRITNPSYNTLQALHDYLSKLK
jgi:hypothetical protein